VLPPVTKRVKYASEEEKKTALKERSKAKNELIKKLLAEYQAAQAGGGLETLRNRRRLSTRGVQSAVWCVGSAPLGTKVLGGALCFVSPLRRSALHGLCAQHRTCRSFGRGCGRRLWAWCRLLVCRKACRQLLSKRRS
jgi:hypothetical protein